MKKTYMFMITVLILLLAACGTSEGEQDTTQGEETTEDSLTPPEVEVQFEEPLPVNEETTIKAVVTQGDKKVGDAEYVEFEIWNDANGEDSSEKVKASHTSDGVYEASYTFKEEGTYQVIAHTQVGDLHTMPQKEVTVGEASTDNTHDEATGKESSHDHGKGEFMAHLMTDDVFKAGTESTLTTHISRMESPFEGAIVRFEISSDKMDKHMFVDAEEAEPGEYIATHTFPSAGNYTINVHYEKPDEEIHGHKKETIEVTE
ncbi:FixH family protein [Halobacillus mangrovi]|uniref:FixH family protein n=1 Tax=Halobacillus mangrovi TaxID=402384 RepID=UPI003D98CFE4